MPCALKPVVARAGVGFHGCGRSVGGGIELRPAGLTGASALVWAYTCRGKRFELGRLLFLFHNRERSER